MLLMGNSTISMVLCRLDSTIPKVPLSTTHGCQGFYIRYTIFWGGSERGHVTKPNIYPSLAGDIIRLSLYTYVYTYYMFPEYPIISPVMLAKQ